MGLETIEGIKKIIVLVEHLENCNKNTFNEVTYTDCEEQLFFPNKVISSKTLVG